MVVNSRIVVFFGFVLRIRLSILSSITTIGGVVVAKGRIIVFFEFGSRRIVLRITELSSFLDSCCVFAYQKCHQS